jgi:hypothetical protein
VSSDEGKPAPAPASQYRASLVALQESLKWLIASSGATAAFVVGGLQLGNAARSPAISICRGSILVAVALLGLGAVFGLLFWAVRILTLPRLTANDLRDRERKARVEAKGRTPDQKIDDDLVTWILDQWTYLLGDAKTIQSLYMDDFVGSRNALVSLREGRTAKWNNQQIEVSDVDARERIQASFEAAERQLGVVEDAAHFERTRLKYRQLIRWFPAGVVVLVVAIAVFTVVSRAPTPDSPAKVTQPIAVDVMVRDRSAARLSTTCRSNELTGVAVDGLLRSPTVIVDGPEGCRGAVIDNGRGVVVIPNPGNSAATHSGVLPDTESNSLQRLRQIARADKPFVATQLADRWVPQLSSKRPGVVDDGVVWDNATTLQEHLHLRQRFNAKLLSSGDWSTFDASDFWVTIAPVTFESSDDALRWCSSQGFDPDHCYAKLVSTTHPVPASTAYN